MKKIILIALVSCSVLTVIAQDAKTPTDAPVKTLDQMLPNFCLDLNLKYGMNSQTFSDLGLSGYTNNVASVSEISKLKYTSDKGLNSIGGDLTIGYFLGKKKMFGIGGGLSYFSQSGKVSFDMFHVEYQSNDVAHNNNVFRQILTGYGSDGTHPFLITEKLNITNFNIPIVLKFKHQFNKHWGITADAGAVVNLVLNNSYSTDASFDYEAAYLQTNLGHYTYDNGAKYNSADWLITKANVMDGNAAGYFQTKQNLGYNVGLNQSPKNKTGTSKFDMPGFGALIQASVFYQLTYNIALNLGGYYMYQMFSNKDAGTWKLTDKVGDYTSLTSGVKNTTYSNYGINFGIRYYFGAQPDIDGDGVPDAVDLCPTKPGPDKFKGCPDTDGDGIADNEDACPLEKGPVCTGGCPDRDGDCIADKVDDCPEEAGSPLFHGCPDRDGDGIADKDDNCPDEPGTKEFMGCPPEKAKKIAMKLLEKTDTSFHAGSWGNSNNNNNGTFLPPHIVMQTSTLNFDFGKSQLSKESEAKLAEAIEVLNKNPKVKMYIAGYTDNIGSKSINILISFGRADAVREYLIKKGVSKDRILISAYGKEDPINENKTAEDRAKNRRIVMKLLLPL